jgi:hypothetical protein
MTMTKPQRRARRKAGEHPAASEPPPHLSPLDFALRIMRDETQPPALRASMAKAAMPYLHQRADGDASPEDEPDEAPKAPPMSDLELARRILTRAQTPAGNPVEKPANAGQEGTQDGALGAKTS